MTIYHGRVGNEKKLKISLSYILYVKRFMPLAISLSAKVFRKVTKRK